jgi:GNAT superfamily N-acetyltransferase
MVNILAINELGLPRQKIDFNRLEFKRLSRECERGDFSCGYAHIDHFFRNNAFTDHESLYSRVTTIHVDGQPKPIGFFSMTIDSEPEWDFTGERSLFEIYFRQKRLMTVNLLWVAVVTQLQRRGVGTFLMGRALDDFYEVATRTGISALTLKPISTDAEIFYATLGFVPYGNAAPFRRRYLLAEALMRAKQETADAQE